HSGQTQPEYHISIVCPVPYPDETVSALRSAIEAAAEDSNGDGKIQVSIHTFRIALGEENQDVNQIGALDADLVGNVSGIFLLYDPQKFEETTNGICIAQQAFPLSACPPLSGLGMDDLSLSVRTGADERYTSLFRTLCGGYERAAKAV
ncbi:MAG: hypothetical protein IK096_06980, partial [Lachnospiraceae bacterium]|nr:hypothetical protein [Lachnospiraceae bacterium]